MANINLIPEQEVALQTKTRVIKLSTILAILLLIIMSGLGVYYFYTAAVLGKQISQHESNIASLRQEITELALVEIASRNLYTKSSTLTTIFSSRRIYSRMYEEITDSTPSSIFVESFSLGTDNTVNLSGDGDTYNSIQDFSNNLLSRNLFTSVALNTVSLDSNNDRINFFIVVSYNSDLLH